jgi:phytoene/squalene synthetase
MQGMKIPYPWTEEEAQAAHAVTAAGRPYLYLASRLLPDPVRRTAFEVAYASMRGVDDAVDERATGPGSLDLRPRVRQWLDRARAAHRPEAAAPAAPGAAGPLHSALARLFRVFDLPFEPWERLGAALLEDLEREGFESVDEFLDYSLGVAVGPGRLFAMVVSAEPQAGPVGPSGVPGALRYVPHPTAHHPAFAELARFTYLVHGLRDLARDLDGPMRGTALAPRAELRGFGLDVAGLLAAPAAARNAWALSIVARARQVRAHAGEPWDGRTRVAGQDAAPAPLPPAPAFVLAFLVRLYERQLDRIEACGGDVFGDAHRMGAADVLEAAAELASQRPGAPANWRALLASELEGTPAPRA